LERCVFNKIKDHVFAVIATCKWGVIKLKI
jgi:hypothetical protein